ncbi:cysteine proteinase, partial [Metschnikowia bicuspidata]
LSATLPSPPLMSDDLALPSLNALKSTTSSLVATAIKVSTKFASVCSHAIALLENFKDQTEKLHGFGYCDYALAYVCYNASDALVQHCLTSPTEGIRLMARQLQETLSKSADDYSTIKAFLRDAAQSASARPLSASFSSLSLSLSFASANSSVAPSLQQLKYADFISPRVLDALLRSSASVLLLDMRRESLFAYSHINYLNVVNVPPEVVEKTLSRNANASDVDLDAELARCLPEKQLLLFRNRHSYDLVVLYNTRYSQPGKDKYASLQCAHDKQHRLSNNPFSALVNLLMWNTKYLSSRLNQYPLILDGGLERWFQTCGQDALVSLTSENALMASVRSTTSSRSADDLANSRYVRKFNVYLSSGTPGATTNRRMLPGDPTGAAANGNSVDIGATNHGFGNFNGADSGSGSRYPAGSSSDRTATSNPNAVHPGFECLTTGLTNLGNSCYMNCVLQCLVATRPLTSFFFVAGPDGKVVQLAEYKQHINRESQLGTKGVVTLTFVKLVQSMVRNQGKYYAPTTFKDTIGSYSPGQQFATTDQHDCIEFLTFMLDALHEDLNMARPKTPRERAALLELSVEDEQKREMLPVRVASAIEWERYLVLNLSVIVDYFQGQFLSRLQCLECRHTSTTYNAFSILSLPIPERFGSNKVTLLDCLDFFTETELLDGDNKWHCPQCKRFTRLTKQIMITRLPAVLIVHFKRFHFSDASGHILKLETFVEYPVDVPLDLTLYWPPVGTFLDAESSSSMSAAKESDILNHLPPRSQAAPFRYTLYGVVNHYGNLTTGHYTSYVHKDNWYYFDDSKYTPNCPRDKVLNKNAYCLFFRRV